MNGRLSGEPRGLGWNGASAADSFRRFAVAREKHMSRSHVTRALEFIYESGEQYREQAREN